MIINSLNYSSNINKIKFQGGLTAQLSKEVYAMPHNDAERLIASYQQPYLIKGFFPQDILKNMRINLPNGTPLCNNIRAFNQSLADQVKKIKQFDVDLIEKVKKIDMEDFACEALLQDARKNLLNRLDYIHYPIKFNLSFDEMVDLLNDEEFNRKIISTGVLKEGEKVHFSYVGSGTYKNCFKMEFLDKNSNPIIHPKALLIGKTVNLRLRCNSIIMKNLDNFMKKTSFQEFQDNMIKRINDKKNFSDDVKKHAISCIKSFYEGGYNDLSTFNGLMCFEDFKDINGIFPETNVALTIRRDLGKNMDKSNCIRPFISDFKNQFMLMEFADENVTETEFEYSFVKKHLQWIDAKYDNYYIPKKYGWSKRKIIDYGSIFPDNRSFYAQ